MKRFPTLRSLAAAREQSVLREWEGLGYYSRARNLHRAAKIIVQRLRGRIPGDRGSLQELPGIGPYTAAAISSIAFGRDESALDGNARRVLARVFNVRKEVDSKPGATLLRKLAAENLPEGRAGEFNQALMDLGATTCIPKGPRCDVCPLASLCEARRLGTQGKLPRLGLSKQIPRRLAAAAVIRRRDRVLIARRPPKGLLGGMWHFPTVGLSASPDHPRRGGKRIASRFRRLYGFEISGAAWSGTIRHRYSHFHVTVQVYDCSMEATKWARDIRWVRTKDLETYPMGKVDRQIARSLNP
jgi:A/G-specific adenine glycosylase